MKSTKKKNLFYVHVIITVLLMFGFGFLPPLDPITPMDMKLVGVFLGVVYAWSTTSMIWPSLLGMIPIILSGVVDLKTLFINGFGNETVVFIMLVFVFAAAIEATGLTEYLARFLMNLRWAKGHPWRLVFIILFGSYFISAVTSLYPVVLIFWTIIYDICQTAGYKPYDKFPTLMIIGIMICGILGSLLLPFKTTGMMFSGAYNALTGKTVDFLSWIGFSFPVGMLGILVYMLLMRFIFRVDLAKMQAVDGNVLEMKKITQKQSLALIMLMIFVTLPILSSVIPKTSLGQFLTRMGAPGILICVLVVMMLIKVDDEPLLDFKTAAKSGIIWDVIIMFSVVFPLSSYLTAEGTGVKEFLNSVIGPLVVNQSPMLFGLLILLLATVITNFANNAVVALIFLSILTSLAETMGINETPIAIALVFCTQYALLTPAASAPAAILFGNTEWLQTKEVYKVAAVTVASLTILTIICAFTFGTMIFR